MKTLPVGIENNHSVRCSNKFRFLDRVSCCESPSLRVRLKFWALPCLDYRKKQLSHGFLSPCRRLPGSRGHQKYGYQITVSKRSIEHYFDLLTRGYATSDLKTKREKHLPSYAQQCSPQDQTFCWYKKGILRWVGNTVNFTNNWSESSNLIFYNNPPKKNNSCPPQLFIMTNRLL